MEVANASLYDGGTALAEACLMAARITRRDAIAVASSVHPAQRAVTDAYIQALGLAKTLVPYAPSGRIDLDRAAAELDGETACLAVGYPNFFGVIEDLGALAELAHASGALLTAVVNPIALGMLPAPGDIGVDIVVAEGQPLGLPMQYGGPYLGLLATTRKHMRQMPGRVVGETEDGAGRRGYVMTLRAREQDIRRDKATSNICTNQALAALVATIYMAAMGESGLAQVAAHCYHKAHFAFNRITRSSGARAVFDGPFFHEFAVQTPRPAHELRSALRSQGIVGPYDLGRDYPELEGAGLFCVTEMNSRSQIDRLVAALEN
jgi:glycine dehydrogenase subunit 1